MPFYSEYFMFFGFNGPCVWVGEEVVFFIGMMFHSGCSLFRSMLEKNVNASPLVPTNVVKSLTVV